MCSAHLKLNFLLDYVSSLVHTLSVSSPLTFFSPSSSSPLSLVLIIMIISINNSNRPMIPPKPNQEREKERKREEHYFSHRTLLTFYQYGWWWRWDGHGNGGMCVLSLPTLSHMSTHTKLTHRQFKFMLRTKAYLLRNFKYSYSSISTLYTYHIWIHIQKYLCFLVNFLDFAWLQEHVSVCMPCAVTCLFLYSHMSIDKHECIIHSFSYVSCSFKQKPFKVTSKITSVTPTTKNRPKKDTYPHVPDF